MKLELWLAKAEKKLSEVGIGTARLDSLILAEDLLDVDRARLLAHPETELNNSQLRHLNRQLARRAIHEPLAYVRGFSEFYGRRFKVNEHVLEPRPESETMIDLLKDLYKSRLHEAKKWTIADVGTGSGCLGITAALELANHNVDLYDIDAAALAVAKHNSVMHELHLHAYKRDLLTKTARPYDVILANLPYVPANFYINAAAAMEPRIAIAGGRDGLEVYRRFFSQVTKLTSRPKFILTEALPPQHTELGRIAKTVGFKLKTTADFIQLFELTG